MKKPNAALIQDNKIFGWLAVGTGLILLLPFLAMRFTAEVNWTLSDFIVMGTLLFGTGSAFVLTARRIQRQYWLLAGIVFTLALLWLWAELAVGVFTNWGS